jgi:hypothetical protein
MIPNLGIMLCPHVRTTDWRRRARGLALAAAASGAAVGLSLPAMANAEAPVIGSIKASSEYSGQETIEVQIDPESYETVWTISLDCPDQPRCQSTEGRLPAGDGSHTVTVVMAGLENDTHYGFSGEASSPAGATNFSGEFESIPAGAAPEGVKDKEVYTPPPLSWTTQSLKESAEQTVREQREKEHAEQAAKEAASHATAEAEVAAATHQAAVHPETKPACVVPKLKGDTLAAARRALTAAHCRLGTVHRPSLQHGTLRVRRQSARVGKHLANDARVALWIEATNGAKQAHR